MPRFSIYRGARFYSPFGTSTMRRYRKTYAIRRMSRPGRVGGFWPGTRSTFRRVTKFRRIPGIGTIRRTYTIPELKYIDASTVGTVIDESGNITLLNGLLTGTSATSRVGMRIQMRSVHLKYMINGPVYTNPASTSPMAQTVRIMLVLDMQPNGATFALSDLLEDTTPGIGIVSSLYMANAARFKVLYDKRVTVTAAIVTASAAEVQFAENKTVYDETYLKLSHEVHYANSNNGDITDMRTGALFLVTLCDTAAALTQPLITSYVRLRYHDN